MIRIIIINNIRKGEGDEEKHNGEEIIINRCDEGPGTPFHFIPHSRASSDQREFVK